MDQCFIFYEVTFIIASTQSAKRGVMKVLLKDGVHFYLHNHQNEMELQKLVEQNIDHIFGEDTFFLPGKRIGVPRGQKGAKGIPDGFVVLIKEKKWAIIEVELASHPIHDHIISQVSRFNQAWKKGETTKEMVDLFFQACKDSKLIQNKFEQYGIKEEIYHYLSSIFKEDPLLVIIIDELTPELDEVKDNVKFDTRWCVFKTYRREGISDLVPIFEYEPIFNHDKSYLKNHDGATEQVPAQTVEVNLTEGSRNLTFLNNTVSFRHSKEIPVIVANELIKTGLLNDDNVPWGPGKKRYVINKTPRHQTGKDFVSPVQLTNGWWVETHASEVDNISRASRLIKACGLDGQIRVE